MTDVAVAGGGLIGLATAWRAARRGLSVTVVDDSPGTGASAAAAGMLAPVTEAGYREEALLRLGLASVQRWPAFAADVEAASGTPVGLTGLERAFDDRLAGTPGGVLYAGDRVIASIRVQDPQEAPPELLTGRPGRSGKVCGEEPSRRALTPMPSSSAVASTYGLTDEPGWRRAWA